MRRLTLATILVFLSLIASSVSVAAVHRVRQCPTISVSCPDTVRGDSIITLTTEVSGATSESKLTYNWTVSKGAITSGQGTNSIVLDLTGIGGITITGTVEIAGMPESCARMASCTVQAIDGGRRHPRTEAYGNIRFIDEKARLDNIAVELQNDPTALGYFICYGGRVGYKGEAQTRCDRAKKYLVNARGIEAKRVVTLNGGYRENMTVEPWILPAGATPPMPIPTVDPSEVKIIRSKPKRKIRRH